MGEEANFEFKGSLNDFLDAAHRPPRQANGRRVAVGGPPDGPAPDITALTLAAKVGRQQFGPEAFALLLNPVDLMRMESLYGELNGYSVEALMEEVNESSIEFDGLICQAAQFINEGTYLIVDEFDYKELVENNPDMK